MQTFDDVHFILNYLQVYVLSRVGRVSFYKDQKASKSQPEQTFRGEPALELQGANVEIANDYTKKKHVFRVKWVFSSILLISIYSKYERLLILGFQMEENSYCKRMMTQKCSNGLDRWKLSVTKPEPRVDHKHCQRHRRKTSRSEDHSSHSRKSKRRKYRLSLFFSVVICLWNVTMY